MKQTQHCLTKVDISIRMCLFRESKWICNDPLCKISIRLLICFVFVFLLFYFFFVCFLFVCLFVYFLFSLFVFISFLGFFLVFFCFVYWEFIRKVNIINNQRYRFIISYYLKKNNCVNFPSSILKICKDPLCTFAQFN